MPHQSFNNLLYILITAVTAAISIPATAETPVVADTLSVISNAKSVIITSSSTSTVIDIKGIPDEYGQEIGYSLTIDVDSMSHDNSHEPTWNLNLPFLQDKTATPIRKLSLTGPRNLYAGVLMPLSAPDGISKSYELGIGMLIGAAYRTGRNTPEISIGIGAGFVSVKTDQGSILTKTDDILTLEPALDEAFEAKSSLSSFRIEIPIMISQKIYRALGFTAGAIVNLNTYTSASSEWDCGDTHHKVTYKGLQQRILSADLIAIVGLSEYIGAYVRFSPADMFHRGYGPEFSRLSAGVSIGF